MSKYALGKQKTLADLCEKKDKRIRELEEWLDDEAGRNSTCIYNILNKVCSGCKCERSRK